MDLVTYKELGRPQPDDCVQYTEEMKTSSCAAILWVSGCLIICGIIAFLAFKVWKRQFGSFTRLRSERKWQSPREPVENDDETCKTVSFIM